MTEGLRIRFIQDSGSISVGDVDHFYLTKYSRLEWRNEEKSCLSVILPD